MSENNKFVLQSLLLYNLKETESDFAKGWKTHCYHCQYCYYLL